MVQPQDRITVRIAVLALCRSIFLKIQILCSVVGDSSSRVQMSESLLGCSCGRDFFRLLVNVEDKLVDGDGFVLVLFFVLILAVNVHSDSAQ